MSQFGVSAGAVVVVVPVSGCADRIYIFYETLDFDGDVDEPVLGVLGNDEPRYG